MFIWNLIKEQLASLSFTEAVGLVSDIAVLVLTVYTLHITAFSKKLSFVNVSILSTRFYGDSICVSLENKVLHSIPVTKVFLMKCCEGIEKDDEEPNLKETSKYYCIVIAKYEEPLVIDSWHIGRIESGNYTKIDGYRELFGLDELTSNAVMGVELGDKIIWLNPNPRPKLKYTFQHWKSYSPFALMKGKIRDKKIIQAARKAYEKHSFKQLTVSRKLHGDTVLSESTNYVINLLGTDLNGMRSWNTVYAIADKNVVHLNKMICGYNALRTEAGKSPGLLKQYLCEQFGIDEKNVFVDRI